MTAGHTGGLPIARDCLDIVDVAWNTSLELSRGYICGASRVSVTKQNLFSALISVDCFV